MDNSSFTSEFFENLGKLFFAIAASDNRVETKEIITLKTILKTEWTTVDGFDYHAIKHIVFVFELLQADNNANCSKCYLDFVNYKNRHKYLFSGEVKHLILQTSNAIASSFSGRNKSELIMLAKLDIELKK